MEGYFGDRPGHSLWNFHLREYATFGICRLVKVIQVYKCLCDEFRLRILNLLKDGPLCVCHLIEILDCDQVRMSKQLRYMKELGMVEGTRQAQWIVYRLADPTHPILAENLKCLQDYTREQFYFAEDLRKRARIIERLEASGEPCPDLLNAPGK